MATPPFRKNANTSIPSEVEGYRVTAQLGAGGLGVVALAENEQGEQVAIKFLTDLSEKSRGRFHRELKFGLSLIHPNLVRTLSGGKVGDLPYLILEFLPGRNLGSVLRPRALEPDAALDLAVQFADGLEYLHGKALIHRDLKPDNLQILPDGTLKILDLGLLRAPERTQLTATGTVMGTFLYMAPEQMQAKEAGPEADLFSMALILYRMLAQRNPFTTDPMIQLGQYIPLLLAGDHLPLDPAQPDSPLESFFRRGLAKDPEDRFASAQQVAEAFHLALYASGMTRREPAGDATLTDVIPAGAPSRTSVAVAALSVSETSSLEVAAPVSRARPPRLALGFVALGVFICAAAAGWFVFLPHPLAKVLDVRLLAVTDRHTLALVTTDRPTMLRLGDQHPHPFEGALHHLVGLEDGQDTLRLFDDQGRGLPPRGLPEGRAHPVLWDGGQFSVADGPTFALSAEDAADLWPDDPVLPTPEEHFQDFLQRTLEFDLVAWSDELMIQKSSPIRLPEVVQKLGIDTLYSNCRERLAATLDDLPGLASADLPAWRAAHSVVILDAFLRVNGLKSPFDPDVEILREDLFEGDFYDSGSRPPSQPGRETFAQNQDLILVEMPDDRQSDTFSDIFFKKREPVRLAPPPGEDPVSVEMFFTQVERFTPEFFGILEIDGVGPLFFFEEFHASQLEAWRVRHPGLPGMRRVFRLRLPQALVTPEMHLDVRFKPWRFSLNRPYDHVIMQAIGLTRAHSR